MLVRQLAHGAQALEMDTVRLIHRADLWHREVRVTGWHTWWGRIRPKHPDLHFVRARMAEQRSRSPRIGIEEVLAEVRNVVEPRGRLIQRHPPVNGERVGAGGILGQRDRRAAGGRERALAVEHRAPDVEAVDRGAMPAREVRVGAGSHRGAIRFHGRWWAEEGRLRDQPGHDAADHRLLPEIGNLERGPQVYPA